MDLTCEGCESSTAIDPEFYDNFRISVCFSCKDSNSLYKIITKTQARSEFLLTDEELADSALLPSISRKNPHNPRWADMKLYLKKQVRDFSIKKHGSEEALKEELSNRNDVRSDRKSKQFLKKLKELRSKTKVEKRVNLIEKKVHTHSYSNDVCIICGLKVFREEI